MTYTRLNPYDSGWITATLNSGFEPYGDGDDVKPAYRKVGNVVTVNGVVKPKTAIATGSGANILTLPEGFRPSRQFATICQGSGNAIWCLHVFTNGVLYLERYRTGGTSEIANVGVWLPFCITFVAA